MVKQTAGRDALTGFADEFAHLNDDILFGEVWSREDKLSIKMRSILTITVLVSKGLIDSSFQYHMQTAKKNGVTKAEIGEILTHVAFYAGWPNAWAAFRVALEVYKNDKGKDGGMFGLGEPNDAYAQYFIGKSYLSHLRIRRRPCSWRMSPSSLDAAITGISITLTKAEDRFFSAHRAEDGIRRKEKKQ